MGEDRRLWHDYHEATKLPPGDAEHTTVDWTDQPRPYKLYRDLDRVVSLPRQLTASKVPALLALSESSKTQSDALDLQTLATILHHSAGIVRRLKLRSGETMLFRAAACTGALYHVELYLVCGPPSGLEAGVYHFAVHDFSLGLLRSGDFRGALAEATGSEPHISRAPLSVVCTSTFWRNAWRYGPRSYRHSYWDSGTILANILGMASAHGLSAHVVTGFVDAAVNRLIGVDGEREAAVALVSLGDGAPVPVSPPVKEISPPTVPVAVREVVFPLVQSVHNGSSLDDPRAVAAWRGQRADPPPVPSDWSPPAILPLVSELADLAARCPESVEAVIARRGSARRFAEEPVSAEDLAILLAVANRPVPLDVQNAQGPSLNGVYVIVNGVDGMAPGSYVWRPTNRSSSPCGRAISAHGRTSSPFPNASPARPRSTSTSWLTWNRSVGATAIAATAQRSWTRASGAGGSTLLPTRSDWPRAGSRSSTTR